MDPTVILLWPPKRYAGLLDVELLANGTSHSLTSTNSALRRVVADGIGPDEDRYPRPPGRVFLRDRETVLGLGVERLAVAQNAVRAPIGKKLGPRRRPRNTRTLRARAPLRPPRCGPARPPQVHADIVQQRAAQRHAVGRRRGAGRGERRGIGAQLRRQRRVRGRRDSGTARSESGRPVWPRRTGRRRRRVPPAARGRQRPRTPSRRRREPDRPCDRRRAPPPRAPERPLRPATAATAAGAGRPRAAGPDASAA